jgi:hypothetical protein
VAFEPDPAVAFNQANDQMKGFEGDRLFLGQNPAPGATLAYRLKADAKDVKWTIRDAGGRVVRELSGDAVKGQSVAGLNIVKWDLRIQPLRPVPPPPGANGQTGGGGGGFGGGGNNGPFVLPGTYRATLTVDGRDTAPVAVTVKGDPDIAISEADRRTWFETASDVHQMQQAANDAAAVVQQAWAQFQQLQAQTRGQTLSPASKGAMEAVQKELEVARGRLGLAGGGFGNAQNVRGRIGQLKNAIMGSTAVPTTTQLMQIREARAAMPLVIDQANAAIGKLPALVKDLVGAGAVFPALKPIPR